MLPDAFDLGSALVTTSHPSRCTGWAHCICECGSRTSAVRRVRPARRCESRVRISSTTWKHPYHDRRETSNLPNGIYAVDSALVHFVGAHGYVYIWALVVEDILHATLFRPVLAILGPDECFMGFDTAVFLDILDPGPVVSTVFLDIAYVRHDHRPVEHEDVMGHGWRFLDELYCSSDV